MPTTFATSDSPRGDADIAFADESAAPFEELRSAANADATWSLRGWLLRTVCLAHLAVVAWLLLVPDPWVLVRPYPELRAGLDGLKTWAHGIAFGLLGMFAWSTPWPWRRAWSMAACVVFAVLTEVAQAAWLPTRHAEVDDLLQNLVGLSVGAMAAWALGEVWAGRPQSHASHTR